MATSTPTRRNRDIFRALNEQPRTRSATSGSDGSLMHGHFSIFDTWYEIKSALEGHFLERTAAGAFKKTMMERRDLIKVQFDHGHDPHVGGSPLGPIDVLREDDLGAYFEVPLLDTDYNRDRILPMLRGQLMNGEARGSVLGSSFRFAVVRDEWVQPKKATPANPAQIPERTIREVRLYEFGPVIFPAAPGATAKVRSLTDHYAQVRDQRSTGARGRSLASVQVEIARLRQKPATTTGGGRSLASVQVEIARLRADSR